MSFTRTLLFIVLFLATLTVPGMGQDFAPATNYPTGSQPLGIAKADFNNDGNQDLVVVNSGDQTISIYLGKGDGTFLAPTVVGLTPVVPANFQRPGPVTVATGDFNGDGKQDIAVAFSGTNTPIQILLGNGDGTFQAGVNQVAPSPTFLATNSQLESIDINLDGKTDLIVANISGILIFLNDGTGTFTALGAQPFAGRFIEHFALGDLNNDGRADLVAIASNGVVLEALGNGDGTFQAPITLPFPTTSTVVNLDSIALGDIDKDGRLDIIFSEFGNASTPTPPVIYISLQQADGSFTNPQITLSPTFHPTRLLVGDFNGDGKLDFATLSGSNPNEASAVVVFLNQGLPSFIENSFPVSALPTAFLEASFTNTGALDFASSNLNANEISVLVNQGGNTLTLSSSVNPQAADLAFTLTATVTAKFSSVGIPTGSVTFSDGSTTLATVALDGTGKASLSSQLLPGRHAIEALYSGDSTFVGGSSASLVEQVTKAGAVPNLVSTSSNQNYGLPFTFNVSVVPFDKGGSPTPTGTVNLVLDGSILTSSTLDAQGNASFPISLLPVGQHTAMADYSGDTIYNPGGSAPLTEIITQAFTNAALSSSANPSVRGQSVTFVAVVTPANGGAGQPTGTVVFSDGGNTLGTVTLDANGLASISTSALVVGSHNISVTYSGDTNFRSSVKGNGGATITQVVNKADTNTIVSSNPNPSVSGQNVTLTAAVSAVTPGTGIPSGLVNFSDNGAAIGSSPLDNSGIASLNVASLGVGAHSISASYVGDANFNASSAAGANAITQTVNKSPSATGFTSSPNPSVWQQMVTLTAAVTAAGGGSGLPTGTVIFSDNGIALGNGTLDGTGKASLVVASLGVGSHSISAAYQGDANFNPSQASGASAVSQTVNKSSTSSSLISSTNPAVFGQAVTFAMSVVASGGGGGVPSGPVTFFDGSSQIGSANLDASGVATISVSNFTLGSHSITATYGGSSDYIGSSAGPLSEVVNKSPSLTVVASSSPTSVFGQSVSFTVTVSASGGGAGVPSGPVILMDGSTAIGNAALDASGQVTFAINTLAVGTHSISASYAGDQDFLASAFSGLSETVNPSPTSSTLVSSLNPSVFGQAITFSVTVVASGGGSGIPSGTVHFFDGQSQIGSVNVDQSGVATLTVNNLAVGSHSLFAKYLGSTNFVASGASPVAQVVNKSGSASVVVSSSPSSVFGQGVTFTVMVSAAGGGAGVPSGPVTLLDGSTVIGTVNLDQSGQAVFTVNSFGVGPHSITASYGGDQNFVASTSQASSQNVNKSPAAEALSSSVNPSTFGQQVSVTVQVQASGGGSGTPSGSVTLMDGATTVGTGNVNNLGMAVFALPASTLTVGSHSMTASYAGDGNFLSGSSPVLVHVVNKAPTSTAVASSQNPTTNASSLMLSAAVSTSGVAGVSGSVTFMDGSSPLGSANVDSTGAASLAVSNFASGAHTLTAVYAGDGNFVGSQSSGVGETVVDSHSRVALTLSVNPQIVTEPVTLTAQVTPALGGSATSGVVLFMDGTTTLGSALVVNSSASFTTTTLAVGDHQVMAVYRLQPGTSGPFDGQSVLQTETIQKSNGIIVIGGNGADYAVGLGTASSTIGAGERVSMQVTLTPLNGLTGNVSAFCAGLPQGASCVFNPNPASLDGTNPATATLTIQTSGNGSAPSPQSNGPRFPIGNVPWRPLLLVVALLLMTLMMRTRLRPIGVVALASVLMVGCGGTRFETAPLSNATPAGTYLVTVETESGSLAHAVQFTLTVK